MKIKNQNKEINLSCPICHKKHIDETGLIIEIPHININTGKMDSIKQYHYTCFTKSILGVDNNENI